jgi:hypothetical protein
VDRCQECRNENPSGSSYCNRCGTRLAGGQTQYSLAVVHDGNSVRASFGRPLPSTDANRFWVTIVAASAPDSEYGTWQYVPDGASEVALPAPVRGGSYEVRLHSDYPQRSYHVIARTPIRIASMPRPLPPVRFMLEQRRVAPNQPIRVRFEQPIASNDASGKYWINVVHAWESDEVYGTWQYVADGAIEMELVAPAHAGDYEVRLYSDYPRARVRLAQREPIDVVDDESVN